MKLVNFRADALTLKLLERMFDQVNDSKSSIVRLAIQSLAKEVLNEQQINEIYSEIVAEELQQKKSK